MREEVLSMEHVAYGEEKQLILEQFHMRIFRGEIMGVVCDDNRGKEALTGILQLNQPVQFGRIYYHGNLVNARGYRLGKPNRIAVIRQKPSLIENMTVEENVFVIKGSYRKLLVNRSKLEKQFERFLAEKSLDLDIKGQKLVCELPAYEKAVVELCKALITGIRLVIICDMANYLGAIDLRTYFGLLKKFAEEGCTFLYICDTYDEAKQICGRIALMDHGRIRKIMGNLELEDRLSFQEPLAVQSKGEGIHREALLEFNGVSWRRIRNMSFCVYPGDWISLLDMNNMILEDLVSLMNMRAEASAYTGNILFRGKELKEWKKADITGKGVAFVSENPTKTMLFQELGYMDNLCFRLEQKFGAWMIQPGIRKSVRREYDPILGGEMDEMDITGLDRTALYRLVYYGIHLCNPQLVFCVRPLAEEDVHMKKEVKKLLGELHRKGIAIVELLSNISDLHTPPSRTVIVRNGTVINH